MICQTDNTRYRLICPARKDDGAGYKTLAESLYSFSHLENLPFDIGRLDDGNGVEETLRQKKAWVHKQCKLEYSKSRLKRAEKRKCPEEISTEGAKYTRQGSHSDASSFKSKCFFCDDEASTSDPLHEVCTLSMDAGVRKCAFQLQDQKLLAKLSAGDLIAQEAKYHKRCLTSLYNTARSQGSKERNEDADQISHGIALAELVMYITAKHSNNEMAPVFKLCDLAQLYTQKLKELGVDDLKKLHTTRLKERIMAHFPDMKSQKQGRDALLLFDKDIGMAIRRVVQEDGDESGIHLVRAASIVRHEMLTMSSDKFNGSFSEGCQEASVPKVLLALVRMILDGPGIETKAKAPPQAALTIAQLLQYNCQIRRRQDSTARIHHSMDRETPLPIYLGLETHVHTRKRQLIDTLFGLGLSISYDRILSISTDLANNVSYCYASDGVVCPLKLRQNLFTTAAVDNIDHNPSSTTAKGSFHGTGISLFQHPTRNTLGIERTPMIEPATQHKNTIVPLPEFYTTIMPLMLKTKSPTIPENDVPVLLDSKVEKAIQEEYK